MNIEIIEASIVTQLQGTYTANALSFSAVALPEVESEYRRAIQNPISFVVYIGSTSPGVRNTNASTQDRKLQFSVECLSRILRGDNGLYRMRDFVERSLMGFRPTNCDRLYLVKDDVTRGEDGIWAHVFQFECLTMLVQDDLSDPVVVPSLKRVDLAFENGGEADDPGNGEVITIIDNP